MKPFLVSHSRWAFVTISGTYSLTEKQAQTRLSKCLIQQTKSKVRLHKGDAEENLPFGGAFILLAETL